MAHYIVYWPRIGCRNGKRQGIRGRSRWCLAASIPECPLLPLLRLGCDVSCYPDKKEAVCYGLPVTHKERAFDYCMRELGTLHSALTPEGVALEQEVRGRGSQYYAWNDGEEKFRYFNCLADVPAGLRIIP